MQLKQLPLSMSIGAQHEAPLASKPPTSDPIHNIFQERLVHELVVVGPKSDKNWVEHELEVQGQG